MGNFREKLQRFMYGRYGNDKFNMFLMFAALVVLIISWFTSRYISIFAIAILVYSYYRMFSRNYVKRSAENTKYINITFRLRGFFARYKKMWEQRKTYKFFKCPSCKQQVRVPRGHGRVEITCPKCRANFQRTT